MSYTMMLCNGMADNYETCNFSFSKTKGVESVIKNYDNAIYNQHIEMGECNKLTLTNFSSMLRGTAYDLVVLDNIEVVNMKADTTYSILKWYDYFSKGFLVISLLLVILGRALSRWLPTEAIVVGIIMFVSGAIGMYIDKVRWREKNDYSNL